MFVDVGADSENEVRFCNMFNFALKWSSMAQITHHSCMAENYRKCGVKGLIEMTICAHSAIYLFIIYLYAYIFLIIYSMLW